MSPMIPAKSVRGGRPVALESGVDEADAGLAEIGVWIAACVNAVTEGESTRKGEEVFSGRGVSVGLPVLSVVWVAVGLVDIKVLSEVWVAEVEARSGRQSSVPVVRERVPVPLLLLTMGVVGDRGNAIEGDRGDNVSEVILSCDGCVATGVEGALIFPASGGTSGVGSVRRRTGGETTRSGRSSPLGEGLE